MNSQKEGLSILLSFLPYFRSISHVMKVNDEFEDNRVIVSVIVSYINAL